ncbi:transposase [Larkinella sp. GY13]|uniref:transposase n=1 Tax=Larkinella sp. GY13 TaxID=3453720 RepID=UPI003EEE4F50
MAQDCIDAGIAKSLVLSLCQISRSLFYYKPQCGNRPAGRVCKTITSKRTGGYKFDNQVVGDIRALLAQEFVDYGYYKTTIYLRQTYLINPKKVYRLMKEHGLLNLGNRAYNSTKRQWVKDLVPDPKVEFTYFEFDIKYIYIHARRSHAQVITVLDVFSRWNMGHLIKWKMRQQDVVTLFDTIFEIYLLPAQFYVRNDNGSQFVADMVQTYFRDRNIVQEFNKPATPEQNAHIESYHSILERAVCKRYEFESLPQAIDMLNRFRDLYNLERIHSGLHYRSPYQFLLERGVDMKDLKSTKCSN